MFDQVNVCAGPMALGSLASILTDVGMTMFQFMNPKFGIATLAANEVINPEWESGKKKCYACGGNKNCLILINTARQNTSLFF